MEILVLFEVKMKFLEIVKMMLERQKGSTLSMSIYAKEIGVCPTTLYKWSQGSLVGKGKKSQPLPQKPTIKTLKAICNYFIINEDCEMVEALLEYIFCIPMADIKTCLLKSEDTQWPGE